MASKRQIHVGGVPIGGGAPVAVQTMTKTETANLPATMDQIRRVAEAGADIVRVAVPREQDAEALKTIVAQSPIPIIADIHFNHTLALKAIDAGAALRAPEPRQHRRPGEGRRGRSRVRQAARHAAARRRQLRLAAQAPASSSSTTNPVEALVTAAIEYGRADGAPGLHELQGLDEVDERAEHDRLQPAAQRADPVPAAPRRHRGGHEVVGLAEVGRRPRARCWPTGSATRSGSRSRPSTPRRRSRSPGRSSRR